MASISTQSNGSRRIRFYDGGSQRTVYLGKVSQRTAKTLCEMVEEILAARSSGQPLHSTIADRIGRLAPDFRAKFERVGLLEPSGPREREQETLAAFLEAYMAFRTDVKKSTRDNLLQAKKALIDFFGALTMLADVTPGDADEFRNWLLTKRARPLAANTARRLCARSKQFFTHALRKRLIDENPFAHMRGLMVRGNQERQRFVEAEVIDRVLAGCPDADWRLLVVLCRYGGLRPSEACDLRWEHVDWGEEVLRIRCEKTAHHSGREWRAVPFFPEIVPHLREAWEMADEGAEMVLKNLRSTRNLRKPFQDLLERLGIEPWPKPFQNLRSTRETELAGTFAEHVVCAWLGNTGRVAREHYLQVTPDDHRRAVQHGAAAGQAPDKPPEEGHPGGGNLKCNLKSDLAPVGSQRPEQNGDPGGGEKRPKNPGLDAPCRSVPAGAASQREKASSPSRTRTYNLAVNSRSLYH